MNAAKVGFAALGVMVCIGYQGAKAEPMPWDDLPPGKGRELTYASCSGCHSMMLVQQQGLSREAWEDTLDWMVAEQGMPEPPPVLREQILDYLAQVFSPERPYFTPDPDGPGSVDRP
jgi:cytochrome c